MWREPEWTDVGLHSVTVRPLSSHPQLNKQDVKTQISKEKVAKMQDCLTPNVTFIYLLCICESKQMWLFGTPTSAVYVHNSASATFSI